MNATLEAKTTASLERVEKCIAHWAAQTLLTEPHRLDACITAADLVPTAQAIRDADWGYLSAITGIDLGEEAGEFEVLYHFCDGAAVLTLRISLPRESAQIATLCPIYPSASFAERELMEMLGVQVIGTPNTDRLFLPDDWPEGIYPLRKDFRSEEVDA